MEYITYHNMYHIHEVIYMTYGIYLICMKNFKLYVLYYILYNLSVIIKSYQTLHLCDLLFLNSEMYHEECLSGLVSWGADSWLQLRLWSKGPRTEPWIRLRAQQGFCLRILSLSPFAPPLTHAFSPSPKEINKSLRGKKMYHEQLFKPII